MIRKHVGWIVPIVCVLLFTQVSLISQEPEIPYAGEVPLQPNIRPVLVLSGSDHDIGFQYGQQLIQIFGTYYMKGAAAVKLSANDLAAVKEADANLKKYTPWAPAFIKGIADGVTAAGIPMTYEQAVAQYSSGAGGHSAEGGEDCTGWAAWGSATKDGKLICGGSGDHEMRVGTKQALRYETNVMVFPQSGNNFIVSPPTGGAGHPGMNNKGVVFVHHGDTGYCARAMGTRGTDSGVPGILALMHVLRFAKTAEEARDLVLSIPTRIGGLWADVNGTAFDIENRDNPRLIRKPGDNGEKDFIYATNNVFSKELGKCYKPPAGQKVVFVPHAGWLGTQGSRESIPRNLGLWNLFHNYYGQVDINFAKMIWRFTGDAPYYDTIEEANADFDNSQGLRWNGKASETGNAMVGILQPDKGDNGVIHISHGCAAREAEPHWTGLLVYRIQPTYTFVELKLAANPEKVMAAARDRAMFDQYYANKELRKLTYKDVAYAPLDAIFNNAVTEWQKGQFYQDQAKETQGNESALNWAKSIRCFTRCQAYARQVFESLVPPPKRPEDLGLRKWLGEWGDWAVRKGIEEPIY